MSMFRFSVRDGRRVKPLLRVLGLAALLVTAAVFAQEATYSSEYQNRIKSAGAVGGLDDSPFGESVDLYTGATSFQNTDLVLKGTGPTIRIARRSLSGDYSAGNVFARSGFGDWELEIPQLTTLVPGTTKWGSTVGDWRVYDNSYQVTTQRCTFMANGMWSPPANYAGYKTGAVDPAFWWQGYQLRIPGSAEPILMRAAAPGPSSGFFPGVTTSHWQIGCLANTTYGQGGEAFFALSPDGTKYFFTHLTFDEYASYKDTDPYVSSYWSYQPRNIARMKATRIEDRFGNSVTYGYTGEKLTSITGSDGRSVAIEWWSDAPLIKTITANGRTWNYAYVSRSATGGTLSQVTLPDNSSWFFTGVASSPAYGPVSMSGCFGGVGTSPTLYDGSASGITSTYTVKHPAGATGTFQFSNRLRAQSYVSSFCTSEGMEVQPWETDNPYFLVSSLVQRDVSAPGVALASWSYSYEPAKGSVDRDCGANGCPGTTYTDVTAPDGTRSRYIHSTRNAALQSKLLRVEVYESGSTLKRSSDTYYNFSESDRPAIGAFGSALMGISPSYGSENLVVIRKTVTAQQGRNFVWEVPTCSGGLNGYCFDAFGRSTKTVRSSSP